MRCYYVPHRAACGGGAAAGGCEGGRHRRTGARLPGDGSGVRFNINRTSCHHTHLGQDKIKQNADFYSFNLCPAILKIFLLDCL